MAINNSNLDFVQMCGLITLVNDNHMDNYLKEILAFVYYGSTTQKWQKSTKCIWFP